MLTVRGGCSACLGAFVSSGDLCAAIALVDSRIWSALSRSYPVCDEYFLSLSPCDVSGVCRLGKRGPARQEIESKNTRST